MGKWAAASRKPDNQSDHGRQPDGSRGSAEYAPAIADAAKGAVLDAKRRGGSYAAALG